MESQQDTKVKFYHTKWFMWTMLFFIWPVGLYLLWRSSDISKSRKSLMSVVLILIVSSSGIFKTDSNDKSAEKSAMNQTPVVTAQPATPQPPKEPARRVGSNIVGISNKDVSKLNISFSDTVRNDVTKNWRLATFNRSDNFVDYAKSYAEKYMKSDKEIHGIINFSYKTTTAVRDIGGVLEVSVHEYVDKEEHDAKKLFNGMELQRYWVHLDNGDIEKIK